jgi:hypothetical protein
MQISSTASSNQADAHFRAVCRALVAETLEFSDFLVKVSSGIITIIILLLLPSSRFMFYSWPLVFRSRFDYLTYNLLLFSSNSNSFFFYFSGTAAPEDWRELRNNKSETHSHELTELHLADWVSNSGDD